MPSIRSVREGPVAVAIRVVAAAEGLRTPDRARALAFVLRWGRLSPDVDAIVRVLWAAGGDAVVPRLDQILTCAYRLVDVGVDPTRAIEAACRASMPPGLASVVLAAWDVPVPQGTVVPGTDPPTIAGWVAVADSMLVIGLDPTVLLDAVDLPPGLAVVLRAAWVFAARTAIEK